ncbi:MAG: hypothetical protein KC609_10995 [Myxococcales bacterium]|nr:hypothetical protein [Myxococcales bacterium]
MSENDRERRDHERGQQVPPGQAPASGGQTRRASDSRGVLGGEKRPKVPQTAGHVRRREREHRAGLRTVSRRLAGKPSFERLVTRKLKTYAALRQNDERMPSDFPVVALSRRLQALLPGLLRTRYPTGTRASKLLALAESYGTPEEINVALVRLIAIWQLASGKSVDGWLGGPSYQLIAKQEGAQRRARRILTRETTERDLDHAALARTAAATKNVALQQLVSRLHDFETKMQVLETTTNGKPTVDLRVKGLKDISETHQHFRRHKEISEAERTQFRTFIAAARRQVASLSRASTGLSQKRLVALKAKLHRRLRALSPYYSQMAAGLPINKIFGGTASKHSKRYYAITCHIHSMAMAFEGLGKSARDFMGDWDRLLAIARGIDAKRYPDRAALEALRLPEFLMLVSVYEHVGGEPNRVTQTIKKSAYGPNFGGLGSYFGIKSKDGKGTPPKRRDKATIMAELVPLLQSGAQIAVQSVTRNSHYVRLEHLDQDRVIFDDPAGPGKNRELTWPVALQKGYFARYVVFREATSADLYASIIGSFNTATAIRKQKRALAAYDGTPAELANRLLAALRAVLPQHHRRKQIAPMLERIGTPTSVDSALVRLVGVYQSIVLGTSASRVDGWLSRRLKALGFATKRRAHARSRATNRP